MSVEETDFDGTVRSLGASDLVWDEDTPISPVFDDVYFSRDNGLEEARFVFLDGVGLSTLWKPGGHITIAETGFGTGLNFLASWQRWIEDGRQGRFTFVSSEALPLTTSALAAAHAHFPELSELSAMLRAVWPPASPGYHLRSFEGGQVRLILMFGDTVDMYRELDGAVDAWYLDGFSPRKNASMWRDAMLDQIARLAAAGARLATFTAAGFVRRGLQDRGFDVEKAPGYGRKRERLLATWPRPTTLQLQPWYGRSGGMTPDDIVIIGAGVAGTMIAAALAERGLAATIVSSPEKDRASDLKAAVLAPKFKAEDGQQALFGVSAWFNAVHHDVIRRYSHGDPGLRMIASRKLPQATLNKMADYFQWEDRYLRQDEDGSLWFAEGRVVDGEKLSSDLWAGHKRMEASISKIRWQDERWSLHDKNGDKVIESKCLVLATGWQDDSFYQLDDLGMSANRGQTSIVDAVTLSELGFPASGLSFGGYLSPVLADGQRQLGSSFERDPGPDWREPRAEDHEALAGLVKDTLGISEGEIAALFFQIGRRANMYDSTPACGQVPEPDRFRDAMAPLGIDASLPVELSQEFQQAGLYTLTGLGSRGFQYAPLLADMLVADLTSEPSPVPRSMRRYLHPGRKVVRQIIRA